jgi:hypothetical protein
MKNILKQRAHNTQANVLKAALLSVSFMLLSACGEVDSKDGQVLNFTTLPNDSVLTLFCPDAGIAAEPCILNDPDNPYANSPVTQLDENGDAFKWTLDAVAPSNKARFYLWATAQAMNPRGENQYHVALALQGMYTESGSALAREQSLKAYRSVLDNYYDDVWFFKFPAPPVTPTLFLWPKQVRLLTVDNLWDDPNDTVDFPEAGFDPFFTSELEMLQALGEWGYTYEKAIGDIFKN